MDVKYLRNQTGLSQKEFAKLLGTTTRTVQNWEQGICGPSLALKDLIIMKVNHYVNTHGRSNTPDPHRP